MIRNLPKSVKVFLGAIIALFLIIAFSDDPKKNHELSSSSNAEQEAPAVTETESEKISRLANIEQWYYDPAEMGGKRVKGKMGKEYKNYKEIVSAAAYRVAARTNEKVEFVTTQDGKTFTVTTSDGGKYDVELSDLKDKKGRYYDESDAANLPEIKTEYEKWMTKACPVDQDIIDVEKLLAKNTKFPATLDVDWFTSKQDLGVYKDGTRELSVNFSAKNAFGVEIRKTATISISPKCSYKIIKLESY